jgi:lysophospholipase L1-like esterase
MFYWYVLLATSGLYSLFVWLRVRYFSRISRRLIKQTKRVSHKPTAPSRSILVIGDSLWAGVGASDPADSLAGRLRADLPRAQIINKAVSGARIIDGLDQLKEAVDKHGAFDQIIIQLGANDIVTLTGTNQARQDLRELLKRAKTVGSDIAYLVSGSVGFAPMFLPPLDWFYTRMTRQYLKALSAVADELGVNYIDLFYERTRDPFYRNPDKLYAPDKFHPSGAGYGVWYEICRHNLKCFRYEDRI